MAVVIRRGLNIVNMGGESQGKAKRELQDSYHVQKHQVHSLK